MRIYEDQNGLQIVRMDEYEGMVTAGNLYKVTSKKLTEFVVFQKGAPQHHGVNGLTNEALITILIDRITYQDSKCPCEENKEAVSDLKSALAFLELRTKDRETRGVEGTEEP